MLEKRLELHAYIRESFTHSLNIYKRLKKQAQFFFHSPFFCGACFTCIFLGEKKSKTNNKKKRKVNVKINVKKVIKKEKKRKHEEYV